MDATGRGVEDGWTLSYHIPQGRIGDFAFSGGRNHPAHRAAVTCGHGRTHQVTTHQMSASMTRHGSPARVAALWLLVCLLALDFFGAPLHDHPRAAQPAHPNPVKLQSMEGAAAPRLPAGPETVTDHAPAVPVATTASLDSEKGTETAAYSLLGGLADFRTGSKGMLIRTCRAGPDVLAPTLHRSIPPEGRGPPLLA